MSSVKSANENQLLFTEKNYTNRRIKRFSSGIRFNEGTKRENLVP